MRIGGGAFLGSILTSSILLLGRIALAAPAEREAATVDLGGKVPLTLTVFRQRTADGGLKLRLAVAAKGDKKSKSVTLYEGGADDDAPTDKSFRSATVEPFALPGGRRGARVDFEFQVPGSRKFRQVDTYLVSVDDPPRKVLETTTRRERKRTKVCNEVEEATLAVDKEKLYVKPVSALESELDDDDLPRDKTCHGKLPGQQVTYRFDGEAFFQIDPPPAEKAKKPAAEESDD
jgi:hypothetical protein